MKTAALTLALVLTGISACPLRSADKPNLVFILADDLGYRELGCYGQEKIRTPRIDALASQGMRFTRAYSGNAVCAPSRCVLMTGRHPGHATVRDNVAVEPEGQYPLNDGDITLAELLQSQGYACGAFGKWGLGNTGSTGNPLRQGFDRFFGYNCQSHAHSYYPATLWSDNEIFPLKNDPPVPGHAGLAEGADPSDPRSYAAFQGQDYAPDRIHEAALEFLRKNKDRPFFLHYPSIMPHVALQVPEVELAPYHALGWNDPPFTRKKKGYTPHFTPRAAYAAMISHLDRQVGELVDLIDGLGLGENTIIVFTSDNGTTHLRDEVDTEFFKSVGELRGLKGDLYEGGVRIPQIVRWTGRIAAGSTSGRVTGFEDWLPTVLDLAGASAAIPDGIDGISFAPTLLGERQPERKFLYREFRSYGGQQAVWLGRRWKGIRTGLNKKNTEPDFSVAFYDLVADPSESHDVAADHPEIVKEVEAILRREHRDSEAFPFPAIDGQR